MRQFNSIWVIYWVIWIHELYKLMCNYGSRISHCCNFTSDTHLDTMLKCDRKTQTLWQMWFSYFSLKVGFCSTHASHLKPNCFAFIVCFSSNGCSSVRIKWPTLAAIYSFSDCSVSASCMYMHRSGVGMHPAVEYRHSETIINLTLKWTCANNGLDALTRIWAQRN